MILIGQYDSPFVRRVAVALNLYGFPYEHRPWSTFGDGDKLAAYNPLRRVPTLVLEGGEVLIESSAILEYLDELVGPDRALTPAHGPERRAALKVSALATGLCDKMVSLVYERVLHEAPSDAWVVRCETQIGNVLDALEEDRVRRSGGFWFGKRLGHVDVVVTCAIRFLREAHPAIFRLGRWPRLVAQASVCEALEAFGSVVQRFDPPER